jgi:hypothetical protein
LAAPRSIATTRSAPSARHLDDVRADPAGAEDGDGRAGADAGDVVRGPVGGQQRAAEDRRVGQRQRVGQRRDGQRRDHRQLAQTAHRVHRDRLAVGVVEAGAPVVERPVEAVVGEEPLAQLLAPGPAQAALAAGHDERGHDPLADGDVVDAVADRRDRSRHLVAEHARHRERHRAVVHVQVGVADAARRDAHEHLARARLGVAQLLDPERPRRPADNRCLHLSSSLPADPRRA